MPDQPLTEATVRQTLSKFQDPETGRSAAQLGQLHRVEVADGRVGVTLGLTTWAGPLWDETKAEVQKLFREKLPGVDVEVRVEPHARRPEPMGEIGLPVKTVLAVGSGKGGVGKSSVAVCLAFALARAGCKVGLLDADVYGPSVPHLLGSVDRPQMVNEKIQPILIDGVPVMSMGFLVPPGEAVIWRGPMLHGALTQFLRDTAWGDLDFLVVDMPPGTGDVPLSISQLVPLSGAVVVCTPQDVALLDAVKAITMFRKVNIEVVGMVENMSFFICDQCSARHDIFGSGGARRRATELSVPFLGEVPINVRWRILADQGRITAALDDAQIGPYLAKIAQSVVANLAERHRRQPVVPSLSILS